MAGTATKPFLKPGFVRAMLAGHSGLGLAFAALIYVVCLSGTLSVFRHEFERWESPQGPLLEHVTPEVATRAIRAAFADAREAGDADSLYLLMPNERSPRLLAYIYHGLDGGHAVVFDGTGEASATVSTPWTDSLARLHYYLHLPVTWGSLLVGLTGVALLSLLISGLLSHPRLFRDAFALRWGGARRLQEADLHNRLSVWGLPFHLVVSLSGALLGLSSLVIGMLATAAYGGDEAKANAALYGPGAPAMDAPATLPDLAAMLAVIRQTRPDADLRSAYVQGIGTPTQQTTLEAQSPGHLASGESFVFDGNGRLVGSDGAETGSTGQRILGMLQPLHYGWYGGLPVRLAYGALGLALTVITTSGVMIWLSRRRDKGRPAPGWERVWAAMVWSQPIGLGLAAMASPFIGDPWMLRLYLAGLVVAAIVAGIVTDGACVSRRLRAMSAGVLCLVAVAHAATWGRQMTDPVGWIIDLALLLAAVAITAPLLKLAARPRLDVPAASAGK